MTKGFTLIELLVVITILVILLTMAVPRINDVLGEMKQNLYEAQIENIKTGARNWATDNTDQLPLVNEDFIVLTIGDLKQGGYVDVDIKNPKTNELFADSIEVTITRLYNEYQYSVAPE